MNLKSIFLFTALIGLQGCATTLPLNYIPSGSIKGSQQISLADIHYIPSENGEVDANQFQKSSMAIGDIYLSDPVPEIIKTALRKELMTGGFTVEPNSEITIEADVTRFLYDWIGFVEVDFYLDIDFRILKNGSLIFTKKTSAHEKAPKTMAQDTEAIRSAISKCIDNFFNSAHSSHFL